jgi:uncharacterized protein (DUF2252 family)
MRDPVAEFLRYNKPFIERDKALARAKIKRMVEGPFPFFRGTFHLFAKDVIDETFGPLGDAGDELAIVGDIHAENYGTFKGDDGAIHYDINDFDETTTGRFGLDIGRLAASFFLACRDRTDPLERAVHVTLAGITAYTEELARRFKGKHGEADVRADRPSGSAAIDELLREAAAAKREAFLGKITEVKKGGRRFVRSAKYFTLPDDQAAQAARLVEDYRKRIGLDHEPAFFAVEDVAGRVAGIGSMGRFRYAALIAGKGEGKGVLLEFKESMPSAYDTGRGREKGAAALKKRAEAVVGMMRRSQSASNKYLGWAIDGGQSFQVRQLGPHDQRAETNELKPGSMEELARMQACILARVHAKASLSSPGPSATPEELSDPALFIQRVLAFGIACADQACRDHAAFKAASPGLVPK